MQPFKGCILRRRILTDYLRAEFLKVADMQSAGARLRKISQNL